VVRALFWDNSFAIHLNAVLIGFGFQAQFGNFAIDSHPPLLNQVFSASPRGNAPPGEYFLESFGHKRSGLYFHSTKLFIKELFLEGLI
jgi:hypothetical protein